jgi:GT2 family glycosyltransferase
MSNHLSSLSISVVTYGLDKKSESIEVLKQTYQSLLSALSQSSHLLKKIDLFWVSNDLGFNNKQQHSLLQEIHWNHELVTPHFFDQQGNVGFGFGHNLSLPFLSSDYHLVLNPDVILEPEALIKAIEWMQSHPTVGLLSPSVSEKDGKKQYLCKRDSSVWILFLRGFAPRWLKRLFQKRLDWYEMKDVIFPNQESAVFDPPWVSGAFMFFRTDILKKLNGFDPAFFLYFEDTDICYRARKITHLAYVPTVKITHYGGYSAKKGWIHIKLFIRSAWTFFNLHGWRWW